MKAALIILLVLLAACGKKEDMTPRHAPAIERVEDQKTACWRVNDPGMPTSPWNCKDKP